MVSLGLLRFMIKDLQHSVTREFYIFVLHFEEQTFITTVSLFKRVRLTE